MSLFEAKSLNVPLGDLCKKVMKEGTYTFEAPKSVGQIGSFMSNTQIKTSQTFSADLCVEMEESFFSERDYLNYRYFMKRNLYLSHTYLHLMNVKRYSKLKYEFISDYSSTYKPILCLFFEGLITFFSYFSIQKPEFEFNMFNKNFKMNLLK